jgi:hypothetical protein
MDSLNAMMAVEGTRWTKNPKARQIRELLDQEKGRNEWKKNVDTKPLRNHGGRREGR